MLEFAAGLAVGAATMLAIAVTLGARWRQRRRRVDVAHAEMLLLAWQVQDEVARNWYHRTEDLGVIAHRYGDMSERIRMRDAAAARYFAAVGE